MTILYIISLLVSNLVTGFLVFKGVQLGLRWQVEVRQERPPTMETPLETISKISRLEMHPNTKSDEQSNGINPSVIDEWFNGAKENRNG